MKRFISMLKSRVLMIPGKLVTIGFMCFESFLIHIHVEDKNAFKMRLFNFFLNIYVLIYRIAKGKFRACVYIKHTNNYNDEFILLELNTKEKFYIRRKMFSSDIIPVIETFIFRQYERNSDNLENKIILDIGAYIGDSAVYFARRGGNVYSYEPSKELYDIAIKNARLNNCAVNFFNKGVGDKNGRFKLLHPKYHKGRASGGSTTLFDDDDYDSIDPNAKTEEVDIISFFDLLNLFKSVYLAKIDCEGCEFKIFKSLNSDDLDKIEHFIVEYHKEPDEIIALLKNNGFNVQTNKISNSLIFADKI